MIAMLHLVAGVVFAAAAAGTVVRIVRGPTILDRMLASDVLLTILLLVVGAEMVISGHTRTIPVMLVLAGTAAMSTIAVARYVSQQDRDSGDAPADPAPKRRPKGDAAGDR